MAISPSSFNGKSMLIYSSLKMAPIAILASPSEIDLAISYGVTPFSKTLTLWSGNVIFINNPP